MSAASAVRGSLVAASRRHSRVAHEVEDLAHDVILSALRRGLALDDETFLRSIDGAARRHAAFLARSALRRRAREAAEVRAGAGEAVCADAEPTAGDDGAASVAVLSPALRTTLLLLLQGLDKAELRHVLGLNDTALRKRFQALRDHGRLVRPDRPAGSPRFASGPLRRRQLEILRQVAAGSTASASAPRAIGVSDPDGHGIFFSEVLTPADRAATPPRNEPDAPTEARRATRKEAPC